MGFMALGMSLHWVCPFFNATRIFLPPPSTGWLQQDGLWLVHLTKFGELDDGKIYRNHKL